MPAVKTVLPTGAPGPRGSGRPGRATAGLLAIALAAVVAPSGAGAWFGVPPAPPAPVPVSAAMLRGSLDDSPFVPWCAFMFLGPDAPRTARLRVPPGATLPDGAEISVEADEADGDRFADCVRPYLSPTNGPFTGRVAFERTLRLGHTVPSAAVRADAEALVGGLADRIAACAVPGSTITAVRLDVYGSEVRLDAVRSPGIDPRHSSAGTGDGSVHDCVSALLSGARIETGRRRLYPVVRLDP